MSAFPARWAALAVALVSSVPAQAQLLELEPFLDASDGIMTPIAMEAPPGEQDRLLIAELHTGRVKVVIGGKVLPTPFLDLSHDLSIGGERGLLDIAIHPKFAQNQKVYVSYTDANGASVVAEYRASATNPNVADPSTRKVVFGPLPQPDDSHNGGCIEFGPDGHLYLGLGDGGFSFVGDPSNNAQNLGSHLGKLLRIAVDAPAPHVPAGNPFVGLPGALPHIWAYGLRNPWRFSFDRLTGDLWISDVGHFEREEINWQRANAQGGRNYGWRCTEGTKCTGYTGCPCPPSGTTAPFHEYAHTEVTGAFNGCSITGGYVYRGTDMPLLVGRYFFIDYCTSKLWSVRRHVDGSKDVLDHSADVAGYGLGGVASFAQDARGELYLIEPMQHRIMRLDQRPLVTPGFTLPYGCGVNHPSALHVDGGAPELGKTLYVRLDSGPNVAAGSLTALVVSIGPDGNFPCGTLLPSFGGTPFMPGELLIAIGPIEPALHVGGGWDPSKPPVFEVQIPNKLTVFQKPLFLQGITIDAAQGVPQLSDALAVWVGL